MVSKGVRIGIVIVVVVFVGILGLIAYSYTQIQFRLENMAFEGIDWARPSGSTILNAIAGNYLSAAWSLVDGVRLDLTFSATNHGLFPVYIPDLSYDMLVNDVSVGKGQSHVNTELNPGQTKSIPVLQKIQKNSLEPAAANIISNGGVMNIKIVGTAYISLLGLSIPIPFESTKQISVIDEAKSHFFGSSNGNDAGTIAAKVDSTFLTIQYNSYSPGEGNIVTFSGRLSNNDGKPISDALIRLKSNTPLWPDSTFGSGYTDGSGYYRIDWAAHKPHWYSHTANVYTAYDGSGSLGASKSNELTITVS